MIVSNRVADRQSFIKSNNFQKMTNFLKYHFYRRVGKFWAKRYFLVLEELAHNFSSAEIQSFEKSLPFLQKYKQNMKKYRDLARQVKPPALPSIKPARFIKILNF